MKKKDEKRRDKARVDMFALMGELKRRQRQGKGFTDREREELFKLLQVMGRLLDELNTIEKGETE